MIARDLREMVVAALAFDMERVIEPATGGRSEAGADVAPELFL